MIDTAEVQPLDSRNGMKSKLYIKKTSSQKMIDNVLALFIKQLKLSLNVREKLIQLHFYNWLLIYDATHLRF